MGTKLKSIFIEKSNPDGTAALIWDIVKGSNSPKSILSAFGGEARLAGVLNSINQIDKANPVTVDHVFDRKTGETGQEAADRIVDLTKKWDAGDRPSLPALATNWIDILGIDQSQPLVKLLKLVATRSEMVHGLPPAGAKPANDEPAYHNRIHTMQVFQVACYLLQAQKELAQSTSASDPVLAVHLSQEEMLKVLIAAMAHDLDHPGRGNPVDPQTGTTMLFFNEDASVAAIYPLIMAVSDTIEDAEMLYSDIEEYIRYTDPSTPHHDLVDQIATLRNGQTVSLPDYAEHSDAAFLAGAAILMDADMFFSCGAGEEGSRLNSKKLTIEVQASGLSVDFTNAAASKSFFDNIMGDGFLSGPARILFNPLISFFF